MRIWGWLGCTAAAAVALDGGSTRAMELVGTVFESGSVAAAGSAGDGWKFWTDGAGDSPEIGSTGRDFITGTNDEALFLRPFTPGADGGFTGGNAQGVEFTTSTAIDLPAGSRVYLKMEAFSDIAIDENDIKMSFRAGLAGDGGGFLGFDSTSSESFLSEVSYEVNDANRQWRVRTKDITGDSGDSYAYFNESHWVSEDVNEFGDPDNNPAGDENDNFLDRTYESIVLWEPITGGMNAEGKVVDSVGNTTISAAGTNRDGTEHGEIKTPVTSIDRIVIALARYNGEYDGPGGDLDPPPLNWSNGEVGYASSVEYVDGIDPLTDPSGYALADALEIKLGVKSASIGIAEDGDFNVDGVVDGADRLLAEGNLGMTEAAFFDGDNNNDGVVDEDDLAIFDLAGDFNGDGSVDAADYTVWRDNYGVEDESALGSAGDGMNGVDHGDYEVWRANFGAGGDSLFATPEPASALLLGLVAGAAAIRRRR